MYAAALLIPSVFRPRPSHSSLARKCRSFFIRSRDASSAACKAVEVKMRQRDGKRKRVRGMVMSR
jgi:hypothetical protein